MLLLRRNVLGPDHHETAEAMHELAESYLNAGREDEAVALDEQSLAIMRRVFRANHPSLADALNRVAEIYEKTGRVDEAANLRVELEAPQSKK